MSTVKFYYENVPGLGNIAVSRHALARLEEHDISQSLFEDVLFNGEIIPEGQQITWRESKQIRLVIINKPEPFRGAKLVKTVYRIQAQKNSRDYT